MTTVIAALTVCHLDTRLALFTVVILGGLQMLFGVLRQGQYINPDALHRNFWLRL
ncbi:hypothetical protein [Oculatella sp. LEGE 06141]|nr:hypothetical protein [Oculatella sp. LEGE 06141]